VERAGGESIIPRVSEIGDTARGTPGERVPATFLRGDAPLAPLARDYVDALLRGDRRAASGLVMQACDAGTPVKDLYLHVFQSAQREIGRLWQLNRISVAQEHYCTAATQLIMSQLYPHVFAGERNGRTLVMTCVAGELHELGARMVADFFEMDGWDTYFSGANTPSEDVVDAVAERNADLLGISVTMPWHVPAAQQIVEALRAREECARVRILVGGNAFAHDQQAWRATGAHGTAPDAEQAVALAGRLTGPAQA